MPDPDFGPDSGDTLVQNLVYSAEGRFRAEVAPRAYDVVVSRGPEYDAVSTMITVPAGVETPLAARLVRVVDTSGWISSDFHSYSTPSGDNTSSQFDRVQNLLAEHVEFGPCTEHNRISSYAPHLERLRAGHLMATCSGMELTGAILPVNHQNAFPLVERPGEQDGGGRSRSPTRSSSTWTATGSSPTATSSACRSTTRPNPRDTATVTRTTTSTEARSRPRPGWRERAAGAGRHRDRGCGPDSRKTPQLFAV